MTDVSLNVNSPAHLSLLYLPFKMIRLLVLQISSSLFPSLLTILSFELCCLDRPYSINAGEKSNGSFKSRSISKRSLRKSLASI